ncbi:Mth938-like domain-containing protein [Desulfosoma sp.]
MIGDYRFGSMEIAGTTYQADLKIVNGKVIPQWWRKEGHKVYVDDILDILEAQPAVLVVGRGKPGLMKPSNDVRRLCMEKGIQLIDEPTDDAVRTFNELAKAGKKVAGAFHLTC